MTPPANHGWDGVGPGCRLARRGVPHLLVVAPLALTGGVVMGLGCCFGPAGVAVGVYGLLLAGVAAVALVRHVSQGEG